jgi:hypothetical protein
LGSDSKRKGIATNSTSSMSKQRILFKLRHHKDHVRADILNHFEKDALELIEDAGQYAPKVIAATYLCPSKKSHEVLTWYFPNTMTAK